MSLIIRRAVSGYRYAFAEAADPRTASWPLVRPHQALALLTLYLLFVLKWGPKFMRNRAPYALKRTMIAYNAVQIACCACLFALGVAEAWGWRYRWLCEPVDYSRSEHALRVARLVYCYYLLKILDLADTIFFVLRKKHDQVSFLHVYHHTGMVLMVWGAVTFYPGGHGTFTGLVNSLVHVAMYSYYLLAALGARCRRLKKLVTQLQILQFSACIVQMGALLVVADCPYPRWTAALYLPQNAFMLVLFLDFYVKSYAGGPRRGSGLGAAGGAGGGGSKGARGGAVQGLVARDSGAGLRSAKRT